MEHRMIELSAAAPSVETLKAHIHASGGLGTVKAAGALVLVDEFTLQIFG
jgi:hypothetical protein